MKRFLVPILVLACALASGTDAAKWKTFKSAPGRYSAAFPGKPTAEQQPLTSKSGTVVMQLAMAYTPAGATVLVGYADYPGANLDVKAHHEEYFKGCKIGILGHRGNKLVSERKMVLQGKPGREWRIDCATGAHLYIRTFVSKNRAYLTHMKSLGRPDTAEAKRFFDSFRIH